MVPTTSCSGCATSGPSMHWWSLISDVTAWNRATSEVRVGGVVVAGGGLVGGFWGGLGGWALGSWACIFLGVSTVIFVEFISPDL